ncbi:ATP binding [Tulasnella sp. 403]|nr:ATP binding [Tulasnella sp. 403]
MSAVVSRKSPTSPGLNTRPSNNALGRPPSRPQTPSGLREVTTAGAPSTLEPPSGQAYRAFVSTWTDNHVAQWLTEAKCPRVAPLFRNNHIRGDVILDLDQQVLKEMGIISVGDRIKIMSAVKVLRQRCSRTGSAFAIGGVNAISSTPRLLLNNGLDPGFSSPSASRLNGDMLRSPSLSNNSMLPPSSPPGNDISPPNYRTNAGSGRRSDRPPPLHIHHSAQRDLPQVISGNSNGVLTAGLPPPVSAKSVLTPRPTPQQLQQTPSSGSNASSRDRDKDTGSRPGFPALPPAPRVQPPIPPGNGSGLVSGTPASRSNRSLHPSHARDQSQSQGLSPVPSYANDPLPAPPSGSQSSGMQWSGEYGLPRGPAPGNLAGGSYGPAPGRVSPQPHSRSATSRSNGEHGLSHKKSGSLGGAVGNLIAGLKGGNWSGQSNHPYATAAPANENGVNNPYSHSPSGESFHVVAPPPPYTAATSNAGYSVGRGPFPSRSGGSGHHTHPSNGGHGGSPLSLEDLRRRTIKLNLGEPGQTKQTRTIDISECETGVDVLQTVLRKFGKSGGLGHNADDDIIYGDAETGGLVVDGWGVFLESITGDGNGNPLTEAELLALCHADASNPARDKLTLRRIRKVGPLTKLTAFFGEHPPPPPLQLSPTSPTFNVPSARQTPRIEDQAGNSLAIPGNGSPPARPNAGSKKMYRASTVSIMSGLGVGNGWPGSAHSAQSPISPGGAQLLGSASMEAAVSNSSSNAAAKAAPGYSKKLRNFFGQRPPSDIIYTHQQDFFPTAEKKVLERTATARRSMFRGDSNKRMSTISALSSVGIGGGSSDDGYRKSWSKHRSRFSVSSNGSALTPAQSLAAANNPNIPPVPSPTLSTSTKLSGPKPRVSIEEPLPRMSVSTEDGQSVDLTSEDGSEPQVPPKPSLHLLPPLAVGGETLSESLSADFARSPLLSHTTSTGKRTSFLQELRSKRDRSDTASMLTLDEITEKVESRRQSMMGGAMSEGHASDEGEEDEEDDDARSSVRRQSMDVYDEEEEEEEEGTTILEGEEEEEEEEEYEDDDGYGKATTSTGDKRVIKWIKGALIGSGSFGSVYLGMDVQHGLIMAVKQVQLPTGTSANEERKKSMLSALEREIELLKELQHEYIVQYLDSSIDQTHLNIFLEYVPGGSVATLLKNYGAFEEALSRTWVRQILMGLNYLHERDIVHRDIKGANILVDNRGGIKISDFGISKKMEDDTPPDISAEAEDFLNKTFETEHTARPSAADLLQHPWVASQATSVLPK